MQPTYQFLVDLACNPDGLTAWQIDPQRLPETLPEPSRQALLAGDTQALNRILESELSQRAADSLEIGCSIMEVGTDPTPDPEPLPEPYDLPPADQEDDEESPSFES